MAETEILYFLNLLLNLQLMEYNSILKTDLLKSYITFVNKKYLKDLNHFGKIK